MFVSMFRYSGLRGFCAVDGTSGIFGKKHEGVVEGLRVHGLRELGMLGLGSGCLVPGLEVG